MTDIERLERADIVDQKLYKILKYLHRKHFVTVSDAIKKFGPSATYDLMILCRLNFAAYISPKGEVIKFPTSIENDGIFGILSIGNKFVEDRASNFLKWALPIAISLLSIAISVVTLVLSLVQTNSEIVVHLAK